MIKIAVLGYGTVGSGVVEVFEKNSDVIAKNAGQEIEIKYVLDLRDFPGMPVEKILVHDYETIVNDPEVDIVVEVMGGLHPAYEYVKAALEKGKNVCTSNKALVAAYGPQLIALAKEKNINFMFEASVGGGIPIIRTILRSITVDNVLEITGILNGTTNYILTKMYNEGVGYEETLKEAQSLGYAEADPTADVDGFDAARKIAILTSLVYGRHVDFESFNIEGIRNISIEDIMYAKAKEMKIKLLGNTKKINDKVYTQVAPFMIPKEHILYGIDDVTNGIAINGDLLGDTMFLGAGAGKLPTASAVVSDIVDEVKHLNRNIPINWDDTPLKTENHEDIESTFFIRVDKDYELKELIDVKEVLALEELPNEKGIFTGPMTFKELEDKGLDKSKIRSILQVK